MSRRREYLKRPRRSSSNRVWDGATTVLGQPPDKLIVIKAGKGRTTELLIEVQDNVEIQLMGNQKQVCAQLEEMR